MTIIDATIKPGVLLDTNILTRLSQLEGKDLRGSFLAQITKRYTPFICLQNLAEFWSVSTRPRERNGFGLASEAADRLITAFRQEFDMLHETPTTVSTWQALCKKYQVHGARTHDMKLAAMTLSNNLTAFATYNVADFSAVKELHLLNPNI